ncbi:phosphatase PAP2 family protein [Microbacteriaceae bacterium VKM Ac-2855]|nr:phosphatase PAP2 family protein [Microbacteriaceae bacterium VKM Ac-2855]
MGTAQRITRRWIVFAILAVLGLIAVYGLAVLTPQGQAAENSGLRGADLVFGRATGTAASTLAEVTPLGIIAGGVLVASIALIRRRPALMVAALGSIALTTIATQILKNWVFTRPELVDAIDWYTGGSFPSGHTAAAVSLVFALAMVVPARGRNVVLVLGGILVILVGNLTMAASWHRASDVLGADLVAFASASLACAWLSTRAQVGRARKPARRATVRLLVVASVIAAICLGALAIEGIQYYPNETKDLTAFFVQQVLAVSTSAIAVVGFSIAWRGLDVGGSMTQPVPRVRAA